MPDYYPLIKAARFLGQAPWVMAGVPDTASMHIWVEWALTVESAENWVRSQPA